MYHLFGFKACIKNYYCLSNKFNSEKIMTTEQLKTQYLAFLSVHLPKMLLPENIDINLSDDIEMGNRLSECYRVGSSLNDKMQQEVMGSPMSLEDGARLIALTKQSLAALETKHSEYYQLFKLAIHTIFFRNSTKAAAGSTSSALGVIWIGNLAKTNVGDFLELFIHELTHNLVFVDELCHAHYNSYESLSQKKNFARSAILKDQRPLDKVIHSIVVAAEIFLARKTFLSDIGPVKIHPCSEKLREAILASIHSVLAIDDINCLLLPRAFEILNRVKTVIATSDMVTL